MTNNLKAERTLTADELQAIIYGCNVSPRIGTNNGHGHVWKRPDGMVARCGGPKLCSECRADAAIMPSPADPATVKAMALELQSLRSQSLSTQQPMGEVTDDIEHRIFNILVHDYPAPYARVAKLAKKLAALHPNQESGE